MRPEHFSSLNHPDFCELKIRMENKSDLPFIEQLYLCSRDYELESANISEEVAHAFFTQQFQLQQQYLKSHVPDLDRYIIDFQKAGIGRLYMIHNRGSKSLHIVDITLLRQFRNKGLGTALLHLIQNYSVQQRLSLSLKIHYLNPAKELYLRMGFVITGMENEHLEMQFEK